MAFEKRDKQEAEESAILAVGECLPVKRILIKPKFRLGKAQVICLLLAILTLLFPIILDVQTQYKSDKVITTYSEQTSVMDPELVEAKMTEADLYNARLAHIADDTTTKLPPVDEMIVGGGLPFAYITIPKLAERIPIYHGTTFEVLQAGVGHLSDTSLPVGGASTHAALSGHSGMARTRMFDDIDELEIGDTFTIYVMDRVLTYRVFGFDVVSPDDTSSLAIELGRDLCSLITCYPYGVNTHRYIVHGERVPDDEIPGEPTPLSLLNQRTYPLVIALLVVVSLSLIWWRMRPKEIGQTVHGIERFYRHDYMPVLPVLPDALHRVMIFPYIHEDNIKRHVFPRIKRRNIERELRRRREDRERT